MPLIATLVSRPEDRAVSVPLANMASRAAGASAVRWLAEGVACDLALPEVPEIGEMTANLRAALASEPIDVIVQPAEGRRKKILLADMDSTMIDQECIDELADEIGVKEHVAAITARSMNGEIAFEPALRERVALLKGLDTMVVDRIIANRLTLADGARALVQTMRANGAWTALISGGFDVFTSRIAAMLGFQENRANRLIEDGGRFVGTVAEPILGRAAKAEALLDIAARLGLTTQDAVAVGDGANDLDMIRLAGTGVALHAKPAVAEQARIRIDHGDLTALLYLQGYRQDEFVQ
ncbi:MULTISPECIES: phosphoserine phosphatase SerB [unclassified Mesorhizobium]|uniref:phosphoserine phosphatase SerB n=1 Tax=unclassified Mesorhizobium TaxID=325217 RepID=UPI000BB09462|nr:MULTISPECIES: phosphoserine phosphatase SerB [unclassified Mesorhizobium]TGT58797.1 phosphoserine phosphatase SerB [Mesorhizobium sp. M00.F.Ca.ET.170.01.1.1]AZO12270.1 phosphoserine phosphatase SerB [Mesorhizobium sp. M3A.F.Ca.ET.080.04.2.1]PBB84867.1 phosphoserine phosphatase SerB [Mesorhizobium sp. WSM3876]RWB74983.1 MAG: phosphoserine phosphatase SerB [Mesorhizobium sp.]RWB89556.1 MAG: phosphoserine phosphatase SerB [Mesorhizobium sp.]